MYKAKNGCPFRTQHGKILKKKVFLSLLHDRPSRQCFSYIAVMSNCYVDLCCCLAL